MEALRSERKEFTACAITDENLTIWASFDKAEIGKKYVSPADQKGLEVERSASHYSARAQSNVYNIAIPVVLKPRRIGAIFAEISLNKAYEDGQRVGNWILLVAAILFVVGSLGTMTIVATLPLSEAAPAPMGVAKAGGGMDPSLARDLESKREEAAKLAEKVESLKNEELEMVRRMDLHQRELERLETGVAAGPGALQEESEVAKRVEAKKREEALLITRIENLKKTATDLASAPKPERIAEQEKEVLKRVEIKTKEESAVAKRLEALKKEEADTKARLEDLKKAGVAPGAPALKTEEMGRQESEIAQRIEAKKREEAALAGKIEEIRKKVLDLDRRIESRRREELELAQRIEKRRQELGEKAGGGATAG